MGLKIKLVLLLILNLGIVEAKAQTCSRLFQDQVVLSAIRRINLNIPSTQEDPYRMRGVQNDGLTLEEKNWVTQVTQKTLVKARQFGLIDDAAELTLLFFKSEEGSGAFGPTTDTRRSIYLSEATLKKRDTTILVHELGHVFTNLAGSSHLNAMFGIGEALADLSVFFLSDQTHIGSDESKVTPQRSLVDRNDVDFDGLRSANSLATSSNEQHLTPSNYLGGELFSRIVIDILRANAYPQFDFKFFIKKFGQFINHRGASLYQSKIAQQLVDELFKFYGKNGPANLGAVTGLGDCYWALAISLGEALESKAIQKILKTRGIELAILKKLNNVIKDTESSFTRRDFVDPLKKIGDLDYKEFKDSEIRAESEAAEVAKNVQNYLLKYVQVRININWEDPRLGIKVLPNERRVIVPRGFLQLKNMTKDALALTLLRSSFFISHSTKVAQADHLAAVHFNAFLNYIGESFLNNDKLPERNIRANYFITSFEQYFNPTQSAFDPMAQLPETDNWGKSRLVLQERWDASIRGAFQYQMSGK